MLAQAIAADGDGRRAVVGRPRQRSLRRRDPLGDRRRLDCRRLRRGRRREPAHRGCRSRRGPAMCFAARTSSAAAAARRRAASSRPSARSRSCASASATSARRLSRLAEETAGFEADDRAGVEQHRRAERRAPPAGEGDRRLRGAAAARGGRSGAPRPEGRAARPRAPSGRRRARRARSPAGRSAGVDRPARTRPAGGRRAADRGAAPLVRRRAKRPRT